ncbi:MAG TPA: DHA2 family efflux MFS transporter permease subunit [Candidatus Eisenbacteria bacterium]|nr:DHA2 family efflux MFS transporter permease subunit [Candidatus Eisenbacteria bacterium]
MATAALGAAAPVSRDNKWLVALSISFGALMATIDLSIVNVALPQIRGSIGASIDEMAAVATSFAIAQVIVMPLTAFLGRFFGQKRVYLFCLGLFLVGSMICGMARTLTQLVVARAIQGLGGGALQPTQQAILRQTFPPREQGMAMAVFAMAVMIGPAVGPTLGGWIVDNWSWPWIFYINLPVGVLGIFMVSQFVHEPEDIRAANQAIAARMRRNMDWLGIALMSVGLATTQYVLEEGTRNDWFQSPAITIATVLAVGGVVGFIVREFMTPTPAVNLRLFGDSVFSSATLIGGFMFAILMGNMFLLPVFMQELLGFTAMQSGLALMPRSLTMMVVTPLIGRLYNHVSPKILVGLGIVGVAWGSWAMGSFTLDTGVRDINVALIIQGVGFSLLFIPLTTVALSHVPRHHISDASGLNSLVRQFGGSVGLAIFTTFLTRFVVQAQQALAPDISMFRPEALQRLRAIQAGLMARGMAASPARQAALAALQGQVLRQSTVIAFDRTFVLGAVMMICLLPLVFFLRRPPHEEEPAGIAHAAEG